MIEMTDSQALHRTVLLTEAADEVSRAHNGIFIDAPETYYIVREPDGRLTTRPEREFNREFEPKGVSVPKEPGDKGCGNCANFTNEDVNGNGYCEAFKCEQSCDVMPCQEYKPKNQ